MRSLALAFCLMLATVPAAGATTQPTCEEVTEPNALETDAGYLFVDQDDPAVEEWEETNRLDGLQTEGCMGPNGRNLPADTQVASYPWDAIETVGGTVEDVNELALELCNAVLDIPPGHQRCV